MRSPVASVSTSIVALSKSAVDWVWDVKITALPPGSTCGQRCVASFFALSSVVTGCASPPAAETRNRPLAGLGAKMIVPSSDQLAPRLLVTLVSVRGVPPVTGTFRISAAVT